MTKTKPIEDPPGQFEVSLLVLFASGLVLYKSCQVIINSGNRELLATFQKEEPIGEIPPGITINYGIRNPGVSILIFNDFPRSYCRIASKRYREIAGEYGAEIGIEFVYSFHKNFN